MYPWGNTRHVFKFSKYVILMKKNIKIISFFRIMVFAYNFF